MASKFKQSYQTALSLSYIERLCTSWLLPPTALFALRASIALYAFITRFTILGYESTHPPSDDEDHDTSYFTSLTFWGIAFYFSFAAVHTGSYAFRGRAFLDSWPNVLKFAHSTLYATVTVYAWIVTAVFWSLLSEGAYSSRFNAWSNISEHALNSVFAALEILLPRSDPHPWIQLVPLIILGALYLGLAYLSHSTEHFWVYNFLDPANGSGSVAGYCIGILVGMIVAFALVWGLMWVRRWVTEKKLGMTGKLSNRRSVASRRDEEEMADVSKSTIRANDTK